jgi:hypothetical protein
MSRYHASTGLVTPNASFSNLVATLAGSANAGFKLRRVTWGFSSNNTTPASQQCVLQIARFTAAPSAGTAVTADWLDPNSNHTPQATFTANGGTAFTSAGTITANPPFVLPLNSQSAADMPWEQLEEWIAPTGTANGFAFFTNAALPSSPTTQIAVNVEWEE